MYHLLKFYGHIFSIRQSFKINYLKTDYVISIFKISSRRVVYFASFFRYLYQCVIQQCNKIQVAYLNIFHYNRSILLKYESPVVFKNPEF